VSWGRLAGALYPDAAARRVAAAAPSAPAAAGSRSWVEEPTWGSIGYTSRATARLVPSFARGLDVITAAASSLPFREFTSAGVVEPRPLIAHPDPSQAPSVTYRRTYDDLVCHGRAYWQPTEWARVPGSPDRPWRARYVPAERVTRDPSGRFLLDGRPADLVEFDAGTNGSLEDGWLTIRTALALEQASSNYAQAPAPSTVLRNTGLDIPSDKVDELLNAWEARRRARSTAYVNANLELDSIGWNAAELQLVEGRQHAALEVARVLNLDPVWVGANTPGSSVTYQNRVDLYQALLDTTVMPLVRAVEQRLSLDDLTPHGRTVRADTSAWLRANLSERVAALTALLAAGVVTIAEARSLEPLLDTVRPE
jgi:hypothetical protein